MEHSSEELMVLLNAKPGSRSSQEVSNTIKAFFGNPYTLLKGMGELKSEGGSLGESGFDITLVLKLYESIENMGKDSEVLLHFNKVFDNLRAEADFKAFLKSPNEMKFFFLVVLCRRLFTNEANRTTLLRALELISRASYYSQMFTTWLCELSPDYMRLLIVHLHATLNATCSKLVEAEQTEKNNRMLAEQCQWVCNLLKWLNQSNNSKLRIPRKEFNDEFLSKFFEPVEQFKIYLTHSADFNFVNYPFLLEFGYKHKLMQIESIYEQKMSIRKKMQMGLNAMIQDIDFQGNFSIEGLIYLCFSVNRNNILDDSLEKLGRIKQSLKSPLRISFIGQEGTDEGGVKNEYFSLITKAIFNPYLDMFLPKNNNRFYWFNGHSYELPLRFEFVGMLLGLSLYNSVHLDIHFPEVTYKKLLIKNYQEDHGIEIIEDLREIQPDIYRTLKTILGLTEPEAVDELELYFNIQLESFGEFYIQELVQDGSSTKLSLDNRQYYCLLYADFILNKHIAKQFIPFKRGFYRVVSGGIIDTFEPQELRTLISGIEQIDMEELQASAVYEGGYTAESPVIKHLWELLHKLNLEQKKNFLTFVTGTDRVPIEGLKSLKFLIQRHSNTSNLPTAHTCFNVLLLPEYESKEILEKNLKLILEHNQGFGLI